MYVRLQDNHVPSQLGGFPLIIHHSWEDSRLITKALKDNFSIHVTYGRQISDSFDTYNTKRYIVSTPTLRSRIIALDVLERYLSNIRVSGNVRIYPKDRSDRIGSQTT
jgi:hypothetical protein